ncbi:TPA: hypothetical protein NKU35_003443 [Vibrio parahaemolyticus]|nr:hypothetical protein [Vibrio parahaemolyticus]HCH5494719.1 hypothetical protein [Vibrio parahaemolyticus]HCH6275974.1 hypothetical protein [Vibrio parahaemolyticus]HCH6312401.1 hypothetical protein [Vibrio parahaemolyticus]HCH6482987.1 hypothetical protein [Vibrio parahaemolyticus]
MAGIFRITFQKQALPNKRTPSKAAVWLWIALIRVLELSPSQAKALIALVNRFSDLPLPSKTGLDNALCLFQKETDEADAEETASEIRHRLIKRLEVLGDTGEFHISHEGKLLTEARLDYANEIELTYDFVGGDKVRVFSINGKPILDEAGLFRMAKSGNRITQREVTLLAILDELSLPDKVIIDTIEFMMPEGESIFWRKTREYKYTLYKKLKSSKIPVQTTPLKLKATSSSAQKVRDDVVEIPKTTAISCVDGQWYLLARCNDALLLLAVNEVEQLMLWDKHHSVIVGEWSDETDVMWLCNKNAASDEHSVRAKVIRSNVEASSKKVEIRTRFLRLAMA